MNRRLVAGLAIVLLAALPLFASFDSIERKLESRLGAPTSIPFLGLARLFVKVGHPDGVHDVELAVFEHPPAMIDGHLADAVLRAEVPEGFKPMVRRIAKNGEWTFIYAKPVGDRLEMIVLNGEKSEVVLVRVIVDPAAIQQSIDKPGRYAMTR